METFTPEQLKAELGSISQQVKEFAEKAMADAKSMTAAQKERVDEVLVKQGEIMARLQEAEQKLDRRGNGTPDKPLSQGQQVITSEGYKSLIERGGLKHARDGINFPVKAALSGLTEAGGGAFVQPDTLPTIVGLPMRRMTVRDLLTPGRTSSNSIQYVRETGYTNNAATVSETALKPESTKTFELLNGAVVTIAHYLKASKQILDDAPMLASFIDGNLRYGLMYVEETQLLKGSGTGNNLNGIYTQATSYSAPINPPGTETTIDVIRLMLLQAELAEFPSTGIVLHPSDWALIELTKDSTGAYIFANPQSLATPQLWGRPVVATQAMTVDTALVGAFRLGAQIFDREDANVVVATENEDDFIRNIVTIRAEERLALAVYRPEAFIKNTNLP